MRETPIWEILTGFPPGCQVRTPQVGQDDLPILVAPVVPVSASSVCGLQPKSVLEGSSLSEEEMPELLSTVS